MMKIVIKKSDAKEPFTFAFMNSADKTVVRSENYAAKKSCLNGIESVRKNSQNDNRYQLCESQNGKFYFNIKASNGQIVATSSLFASEAERDEAISFLKDNAATMRIDDLSE